VQVLRFAGLDLLVRGQRWWIGIGVVVLWYAAREVRVDDMLFVQKSVVLLYFAWLIFRYETSGI